MLKSEGDPSSDMIFSIKNNNNVIYLINFSCTNVVSGSEKMELLLIGDLKERAYRLLFILNREYQLLELKNSIQLKTHEDINQQQKEYFLQQQIKTIQEELGGNINEQEIKALKAKAVKKKWSAEVAETFEKEVRKLERLHPQSPDFSIQTHYVQTFVNLPWNEYSKDNFNLNQLKAGNTYLGVRGASDSTAGNQLAYALGKIGTQQRSGIEKQANQLYAQVS